MTRTTNQFQFTPLAFAVAAAIGATSAPVLATPQPFGNITLDASYNLGTNSSVGATNGLTDPTASISSSANGADFFLNRSDAANNNIFFHTYGFDANPTYFGARTSGEGTFFGNTRSSYTTQVTNNSGVIQSIDFSFNVAGGDLGITGAGVGLADLLLSVKRDGTDVARSHTTITQDPTNLVSCTNDNLGSLSSYALCGSPTDNSVIANGGIFTVALGLLDPGASLKLDYDIIATVSGNLTNGTRLDCGYGEGGGGYGAVNALVVVADVPPGCVEVPVPGGAIARSGDPFSSPIFDANGNLIVGPPTFDPSIRATTAQIPEPGTLLIAGLGIAGLARTQRKRRRDLS